MQGKFVLVIAAGDKAVYRNHAIVTERAHGSGGGIHDSLVARSAANDHGFDTSLL